METKRCPRCGEVKPRDEFARRGAGCWCKACHAASNRESKARKRAGLPPRKNKYTEDQIAQWRDCVADKGSYKMAAELFNVNATTVQYHTTHARQAYIENRDKQIVEMRKAGKSMAEIADALGISEATVSSISRKYNLGGHRSQNKRDYSKMYHMPPDEEKAREKINAVPGFEYVGGFTGTDGRCRIKCLACGYEWEQNYQPIRKGHDIKCPKCYKTKSQRTKEEKAKRKEAKRKLAQLQTLLANHQKALSRWKECKECGELFYSTHASQSYCSRRCQSKTNNRKKDAKRRKYKANETLSKLYARDGGRCYLCGGLCSFDDYQIVDNAFIVGPTYPTVEHLIPISRGGDDGEDNIKLACFRCNTIKGRKSVYEITASGQISLAT